MSDFSCYRELFKRIACYETFVLLFLLQEFHAPGCWSECWFEWTGCWLCNRNSRWCWCERYSTTTKALCRNDYHPYLCGSSRSIWSHRGFGVVNKIDQILTKYITTIIWIIRYDWEPFISPLMLCIESNYVQVPHLLGSA